MKFVQLLLCVVTAALPVGVATDLQRFDGWYNNLLNPHWGAVGQPLSRNVTSVYSDEVFLPSRIDGPNPRRLSNELFGTRFVQSEVSNLSALFAHFSYMVQLEITHTDESGCPVELLEVPVPRGDPHFDPKSKGNQNLPYERLAYDKTTGHSPNNPRRQVNPTSSFIDGSFLYGTSAVRTDYMRERGSGKLACQYRFSWFPVDNDVDLPYHTLSYANMKQDSKKLWRLGDTHAFETPPILSLSLLFFHYHNKMAGIASSGGKNSQESFDIARRKTIATMQKIITKDWLPHLTGFQLPEYTGYKPWVQPDVTDIFDAGAINYILTYIPAAMNQLDPNNCQQVRPIKRLCHMFWDAKNAVYRQHLGTEIFLLGLAKQHAEHSDTFIVEDLRSKLYGPLYHSRQDIVVQTIMKGRDYGLPDYNTIRKLVGLPVITDWADINPWLNRTQPELIRNMSALHYGNLSMIDLFVGGMMETTPSGPGPLFTRILMDQFLRIRDGDRFWYENKENGLFDANETEEINKITLADVILTVTGLKPSFLQPDVFQVPDADTNNTGTSCNNVFSIPESDLEECPPHKGYDFFKGSEIPYIIIWTCLGLLPLLCIFAAYLLSKCKQWRHRRRIKELELEKERKRILRRTLSCSVSVHDALEWRGSQTPRAVELHITTKGCIEVFSASGTHLRSIKVENMPTLAVKCSSNKKRNVLMITMAREYDLVLEFQSEPLRSDFESVLSQLASTFKVGFSLLEIRVQEIYKVATTKEKRNKMLEKFFKTIFSEAFQMDYDPSLDNGGHLDMKRQSEEILEIELSKDEFAEAMAVKANSDFVEHFFSMIDSDRNGYISFREFLNAVVLFSKGSTHDKLQTMFYMYDIDGTGYLSKKQMGQMFKSLLELAQSKLDRDDAEILIDSLCEQGGVEKKDEFSLEDFCQLLSPQMGKLSNVSFDWKGLSKVIPPKLKTGLKNGHASENDLRRRSNGAMNFPASNGHGPSLSERLGHFEAVREKYTPLKAKIKLVKHFFENYRSHIFILILFYGICVGLFVERFYYYTFEQENAGYRKLMSYGISVTRGAAASMSFTFSFLLLTMCRNTITFFRNTMLNLFIPFDSHVSFHKVVAWSALFFSAMHIIGYSFNFYHLVTQPTEFLCIFKSLWLRHTAPTFQWWLFSTMTGFTGVLLVLVLCILYVFATQTARRYIFDWFWLTHKLFIILYVLTIIHGVSTVVQKPLFFAYFVGPAIWFTIDKVVSLSRKKTKICILKALNLPSDVTMIEFKRPPRFEYKSGQWVRIACLAQGKDEYHPFTLTSAPHEDTLKLHIRALGPWTWNLRHTIDTINTKDAKTYPKLYLDGPYGAGQQDWYQYDVSVLVGAGIGVTPYASILKDFVHMASINMTYKVRCQKLYFIWITGSQRHFEWLIDILREVEEIDTQGVVSIDIFITQFFQNFDLRTSLLYVFEEHFQRLNGGKSVFTGLKATTHFGRPQLNKIMTAVHCAHPQVRKVGVFSCGPAGVTKGVQRACEDASKQTKAMFEHHFENF